MRHSEKNKRSLAQHITNQDAFEVSIWDGPENKCAVRKKDSLTVPTDLRETVR